MQGLDEGGRLDFESGLFLEAMEALDRGGRTDCGREGGSDSRGGGCPPSLSFLALLDS